MAPLFTGSKLGFGRSAEVAASPPVDIVIANLSSNSYGNSTSVTTATITLPPIFTKLVIFGISGGGGAGNRYDGDDGGGGGGGGAGNITGYDVPFASVVGPTITVAAGYGGQTNPNSPPIGPYSNVVGNQGGPSYVNQPPGYLWRSLGGGGGNAGTNSGPSGVRAGGAGGTISVGTGSAGGAGGNGLARAVPSTPPINGGGGFAGGGGGGGAWIAADTSRGNAGGGASPETYTTPDGKTTITFTWGSGTNLAKVGRPNANSQGGGYESYGVGYSFSSTLPAPTHPASITSPAYQHGGAAGGQNGYNASTNTPWSNYGSGGGGFIVVVAVGVPL